MTGTNRHTWQLVSTHGKRMNETKLGPAPLVPPFGASSKQPTRPPRPPSPVPILATFALPPTPVPILATFALPLSVPILATFALPPHSVPILATFALPCPVPVPDLATFAFPPGSDILLYLEILTPAGAVAHACKSQHFGSDMIMAHCSLNHSAQAMLLAQPPEELGLQGCITKPG
ncbi:hypothetical protein AAY473_000561 [Plecturocebus cupreus]